MPLTHRRHGVHMTEGGREGMPASKVNRLGSRTHRTRVAGVWGKRGYVRVAMWHVLSWVERFWFVYVRLKRGVHGVSKGVSDAPMKHGLAKPYLRGSLCWALAAQRWHTSSCAPCFVGACAHST